ncbi:hypothetical protein [Marinicella litoralis]|uniref:hypothetical protein n=1 Tax=Marinicella litoralis TaxID=644220 RepID=UPI00117FDF5A|nr:hypothetical protein [Marinicella litoralis]
MRIESNSLADALSHVTWSNFQTTQNLKFRYRSVRLPKGQKGCLNYQVDVKKLSQPRGSKQLNQVHADSLVITTDELLLSPSDQKYRSLPQITIHHDQQIQVSAPWRLIKQSATVTQFQIKPSPRYSEGYLAFAPLDQRNIQMGKSRLRLDIMNGDHSKNNDLIEDWVQTMAGSIVSVGQAFPLTELQILVIVTEGSGGVVPWGQVNRGGGQGVLLVVNPQHGKHRLFADWTAAHEFSHLLTPYTPNDRWLSEGFASYHQNITRLRVGLLDEATAWSKLWAGFERGHKSANEHAAPNLKLAGRKNTMQMYWGGAVIALKADVALQQQSHGRMNLSTALGELQNCCLDTGRAWSARQLFTELDRITATDVFMTLYEQVVQKEPYPDYQYLLKSLGVKKNHYGQIVLDDQAPLAHIRKKIANG